MRSVLFLLVFLLGGVLLMQWLAWHPQQPDLRLDSDDLTQAEASLAVSAGPPDDLPDIDHYAVIAERPLFVSDRRPPSGETADETHEEEPPAKLEYDLTAVVMTPAGKTALLQKAGEKEVERALEGDLLQGWTLTQILEDRVVLERQGEKNTIVLRDFSEKQAAPAPRQSSPRARPQPNPRARNPMLPRERGRRDEG